MQAPKEDVGSRPPAPEQEPTQAHSFLSLTPGPAAGASQALDDFLVEFDRIVSDTTDGAKRFAPAGSIAAPARDPGQGSPLLPSAPIPAGAHLLQEDNRRSASQPGQRRASWHVLGYPEFRLYFAGATVSNLGTWLANTAQALLAFHLTHSAFAVGLVVCFQFTPALMVGPIAGTAVARMGNPRNLLISTQLVSAAVAGALAVLQLTGHLTVIWLAAGALGLGTAYCFALPVFSVLVPALVPPDETSPAVAMNSVSYNIGRAAAPVLAVLVITVTGFGLAFILNALSFLVLAAALRKVSPRYGLPRPAKRPRITDGIRAAGKDRIWLLLLMVAAVTIAADPVLVLGPALARNFHVSGDWAGYFLAALGVGTIMGSLLPLPKPSLLRHAAYPLGLLGLAVIVFSRGFSPEICLLAALAAGFACLLAGAVTQTLLLAFAGLNRAAVMALWGIAWAGSKPLASLIDGFLATVSNVHVAGYVLALPALVPALGVIILDSSRLPPLIPGRWKQRLFSVTP